MMDKSKWADAKVQHSAWCIPKNWVSFVIAAATAPTATIINIITVVIIVIKVEKIISFADFDILGLVTPSVSIEGKFSFWAYLFIYACSVVSDSLWPHGL